ncbi:hypothetical protein EXIGLDRAFT_190053 [Exidia glandulosa HHB12029]|uniref:Uncharacterized protein n=1 Tax=Exidia glandulosa HHB12029 TaxID=1314781 RepID=A0A165N009_EXIGL|nr:hypothetical protein EXIGLDRAFT_190053 [Exidia glandulosa HHB12029]
MISRSPASSRGMSVMRARRTELTVVSSVSAPGPNGSFCRHRRRWHHGTLSPTFGAIRAVERYCPLSPRVAAKRVAIICGHGVCACAPAPMTDVQPSTLAPVATTASASPCTSSQTYDLSVVRKPLSLCVRRHARCTHARSWTVLRSSSSIFCVVRMTRNRNYFTGAVLWIYWRGLG